MRSLVIVAAVLAMVGPARAQGPALRLTIEGDAVLAVEGARPGCDALDVTDTSARAVRVAGGVRLFASHFLTRAESGPDLLHLRHDCAVVMRGADNDDPAAYDDRAWLGSLWTADGRTIWATVHDEFQGDRRPALCPTRRYMDCWYNAITAAVSEDGGRSFRRLPGQAPIAALPYRYDAVGIGHHGYFGPSNIVALGDALYMMVFATAAGAQRPGNCLLRTRTVAAPESWRAWDGTAFAVTFSSPYAGPLVPEEHVCTPVAPGRLPWPVTSLVRHAPSGLFIALMLNGAAGGGVYYATSPNLLDWSVPVRLLPAVGLGGWSCGTAAPIGYPSLLDPASPDLTFGTVGGAPVLFAARFNPQGCQAGMDRDLVRWAVRIVNR